jgi:PAN domain-containing protein
MGLYAQQAANLADWNGDPNHKEWRKLRREYEAKLIPTWVRQQLDELEAELVGERARREGVERRDKTLQAQIAKEAQAHQDLKRELDKALNHTAALQATVENVSKARSEAEARGAEAAREIAALKVTVDDVTRARTDAEQRLTKLRQTKAKEIVQSISPLVIAAAVATVGIWTYQLIWPAPQPLPAVISNSMSDLEAKLNAAEVEQQRLTEEVQRQAKAVTEAQTKLQAAQAELQNQAKAATDAEEKRKVAEAEQKRLAEELGKAKAEATKQAALPQSAPIVAAPAQFDIRPNMEAQPKSSRDGQFHGRVVSIDECQQKCVQSATCNAFTLNKATQLCFSYSSPQLVPNATYDSGVRQSLQTPVQTGTAQPPAQQAAALPAGEPVSTKGSFEIRRNTDASGIYYYMTDVASIGECEQVCKEAVKCLVFTYSKRANLSGKNVCFLYDRKAGFVQNNWYDSGIRP